MLLGLFLLAGLDASPARAQLRVCNFHDETVHVAVGFYTGGEWAARGWHTAAPGGCVTPVGSLTNRFYYVYYEGTGENARYEMVGAEHTFCVGGDEAFTIRGTENCAERGYKHRLFGQIDTGQHQWIRLDLRSPEQVREAVGEVRVSMRRSMMRNFVMQLRNVRPYHIAFDLRCYTRSGSNKLIPVEVEGGSTAEVGFVQGWENNFVSGERCEAFFEGERLWDYTIP